MEIDSDKNEENEVMKSETTNEQVANDEGESMMKSTRDVPSQDNVNNEPVTTTTIVTTSASIEKDTGMDIDVNEKKNIDAENAATSVKINHKNTTMKDAKNEIQEDVQTKEDATVEANQMESQSDKVSDMAMENVSEEMENNNVKVKQEESKSITASDTIEEDESKEGENDDVKQKGKGKEAVEEAMVGKMAKKPDPPEKEECETEESAKHPSLSTAANKTKSTASTFPSPDDPFFFDSQHQKDMEKLIQYDADYAKKCTTHIPTGSVIKTTTALTKEELAALDKDEDDFDDTAAVNKKNMNHGIGAVSKFMTKTEKVMEWKRWQAEFLSKIPDQPTFEELGMKNRVFFLEERRKLSKIDEENSKDEGDKERGNEEVKKEEESSDVGQEEVVVTKKRQRDDQSDDDDDDQNKCSDVKGKGKKSRKEKKIIKQKNISLDPVPSFHQQDYSRILMIQSTTLSAALSNTTRETFLQAKNEYEQIFKRSQELQTKKTALENELAKAMYDYRVKVSSINNTIAMAKVKWETEKKAFEKQKIQRIQMKEQMRRNSPSAAIMEAKAMSDKQIVERTMSAAVDRVVIRNASNNHSSGSRATTMRLHHTHTRSIPHQVAMTMAHCIDVVARRAESGWLPDTVIDEGKYGETFPPFVPPASSNPDYIVLNANGETISKLQKRLNAEISRVKALLDASEAARSKAWSRLNKAQAVVNNRPTGNKSTKQPAKSNRQKVSVTTPKYPTPKSVQKQKTSQSRPAYTSPATIAKNPAVASAAAAAEAVKATMKNGKSQTTSSASENKYSLEKVRARMYSDGSVLPVSMPKKGKDGLFLRPAGRQRKGMNWDAVNGKWVPQQPPVNPDPKP